MAFLNEIENMAQGLNPGSVYGIFSNPIFAKLAFFGKIFFWMVVVLFGGALVYKFFLQYKVKVTVRSNIGSGGIEVFDTRAKIVTDKQNKTKLQLYKKVGKKLLSCPIPAASFKNKSGRSNHYDLWMDDNFQLHPINKLEIQTSFKTVEGKEVPTIHTSMKLRPQERDAWARMEDKSLREKFEKKDFVEKYLPATILLVSMIVAFMIWFFAVKELGSGLSGLAGQFQQVAASCVRMGG